MRNESKADQLVRALLEEDGGKIENGSLYYCGHCDDVVLAAFNSKTCPRCERELDPASKRERKPKAK